ncbi:MAG: methionine adenosyltransferase [Kiritimatiellae bacterium]|nr:methionine adenosyltransferase [Kiritimatiellia bacterium]
MSKLNTRHVYTSESVSEGHPDKVADAISDAVLDACLALDDRAHVACETAVGTNLVVNLGEITCRGFETVNTKALAAAVIQRIGYDDPAEGFSYHDFAYVNNLHAQSPDINRGVERDDPEEQGAGDQGMMFGYATNETPAFLPFPLVASHRILKDLATLRHQGTIDYLRPDAKAQVSVLYDGGKPIAITDVVCSHQTRDVPEARIHADVEAVIRETLATTGLLTNETRFHINPTGRFVIGGPAGDSGVTGRKIIVDTYGGVGAHGGGAFSGKDPSKVDRSAAYYARYAAKNIVAAGLADKCEIQVAYAIGVARPMSINIATYGTGKVAEEKIADLLLSGQIFDFRPAALIRDLDLTHPKGWSYSECCTYGHFGHANVPWERIDRAEALKAALL